MRNMVKQTEFLSLNMNKFELNLLKITKNKNGSRVLKGFSDGRQR